MSEKFGEKLRAARVNQRKTLEEVAAAIGSSKAYIWQLENKTNAKPSAEFLLKIANFLGTSPDFFLDDSRSEPDERQLDDAFFRKFVRLSEADKKVIARIITSLDDAEEQ